ncbi:MAG: hypothetical protein RL409_1872 [Gemmatimonadota bacterium]
MRGTSARRGRPVSHAVAASVSRLWLVLVLLSVTCVQAALSQSPATGVTLSGKVQDAETKAALPCLTLQLQTERDSAFVGGRLTNAQGAFTFTGQEERAAGPR